jgi:hypothetical protein
MTTPLPFRQDAAVSLNGLSPWKSNPRLGFDSMKTGAAVPFRCSLRRRIGASLTLTRGGAAVPVARDDGGFCGAERVARAKTPSKCITAVDNAMTAT